MKNGGETTWKGAQGGTQFLFQPSCQVRDAATMVRH